jgi:type VI secretion protein, VC_A0114 family
LYSNLPEKVFSVKFHKPLWEEGVLLSPQHFQQQDKFNNHMHALLMRMMGDFRWGCFQCEFDRQALEVGKIKLDTLQACLPDGTLIDLQAGGRHVNVRNIEGLSLQQRNVVLLALPVYQAHVSNLVDEDETKDTPKRFVKSFEKVEDIFSTEETEFAVEGLNLTIRFDFEQNDDYITCPIGAIEKDETGAFVWAKNYIPPLLSITGSETLFSCLNRITLMVLSRIENLSARRRSRSESVVDFSVSDSMLFWFLHGLNTIYPELKHLNDYPQKHPEEFYKLLVRLLGMLYTFRANESVKEIDSYDHFDLFGTFNRLEQKIRDLLDEVIPSPVIELSLEHLKSTHWRAQIFDDRINADAEFYLSAHSDSVDFLELQKQLPLVSKIGAPDDVERVINTAVVGVPLHHLHQTPPGLPFRMDNVYFRLDKRHVAFDRMMQSQVCSIYVPASISDLHLSLFAVVSI